MFGNKSIGDEYIVVMDIAQGGNRLVAPVGFPKVNLPMIVIRQEYLHICQGDHCAAAILSAFETWTIGKQKRREEEARTRNQVVDSGPIWIYKSQSEMCTDMNGLFGLSKVWTALKKLRKWKFLTSRADPTDRMNRTLQYKFETAAVQAALDGQTAADAASEADDARLSKSTDGDSWNQQIEALNLMTSWLQNQEMGLSELTDGVRQKQQLSLYRESSSENLYREQQQRIADAQAREEQSAAAAENENSDPGDFSTEGNSPEVAAVLERWKEAVRPDLDNDRTRKLLRDACDKIAPGVVLGLIDKFLEKGGKSWALMAMILNDHRQPKHRPEDQDWRRYSESATSMGVDLPWETDEEPEGEPA